MYYYLNILLKYIQFEMEIYYFILVLN